MLGEHLTNSLDERRRNRSPKSSRAAKEVPHHLNPLFLDNIYEKSGYYLFRKFHVIVTEG